MSNGLPVPSGKTDHGSTQSQAVINPPPLSPSSLPDFSSYSIQPSIRAPSPAVLAPDAIHMQRSNSDEYDEAQSETLTAIELSRSDDHHMAVQPIQPPESVHKFDSISVPSNKITAETETYLPKLLEEDEENRGRERERSPPRKLPKEARFANTAIIQDSLDMADDHRREEAVWDEDASTKGRFSTYGAPTRPDYDRSMSSSASVLSEDENFDDDVLYDWSAEEDLDEIEAKHEERFGLNGKKKKKTWGPARVVTFLFSTLIGSTIMAAVLVAIPLIVRYTWLNKNPTNERRYVTANISAWLNFTAFNVLVSWYLAVIVDLIPVAATGLIILFWGEMTENMKSHVETYAVIKGWIKPIFYAACIWGSWAVIFMGIYKLNTAGDTQSRAPYTDTMFDVVEFLFFLILIFCICKILLQLIALKFHTVAFRDRLNDLTETVAVLDRLNLYRPKTRSKSKDYATTGTSARSSLFAVDWASRSRSSSPGPNTFFGQSKARDRSVDSQRNLFGFKSSGRDESIDQIREESNRASSIHSYPPTAQSSPPPPREDLGEEESKTGIKLQNFATGLKKGVKKAVLHDARNIKGKLGNKDIKEVSFSVSTPHAAKNLARAIFKSYRGSAKRTYLIPEDFFGAFDTEQEAQKAFRVFDADGNGDISKSEIKSKIMQTYKERRFLAKSMQDVDHAVGSLNSILLFFGAIILFFVSLSIFGVNIGTQLTSLYTIMIGLSFIFKSAASNAFDAVIFLFVTHPFDTGDRVFIGTENMIVKKMGIFSTQFTRSDGTEAYYYNSVLFGLNILNVRRSGSMFENMTVQVGWNTTNEQIDALEKSICNWLSTDDKRDFAPSTAIMYQSINFQRNIELTIGIPHMANWQDWGAKNARRTRFHAAVKFYMEHHDITCTNSPQPITFIKSSEEYPRSPISNSSPRSPVPGYNGSSLRRSSVSNAMGRRPSLQVPKRRPSVALSKSPAVVLEDDQPSMPEEPMKSVLGFLPPPEDRASLSRLRRRKAISKKSMLAMSAG
ncbi:Predicted mechanosensitive ion channel [Phaffia rhodozyma]|uniref:Predicted mechanosensitive ion channel n=1 Tax=Phaffia rhodozyma TaxID=264483 RepID=A0A0F7SUX1_PHARH|nr:Predicted mechanosensitive ion channel [Phaffia rhodozyma]